MKSTLIKNATIVNEGTIFEGEVLIENGLIKRIVDYSSEPSNSNADITIDALGYYLLPGMIDDQVHFREPGLTHKAEIYTEAKAAVAGGITSFMEMHNTIPNVFTHEILEQKYDLAAKKSLANYSFFLGASNDNIEEILKTDPKKVCGIKIFMGSSTGNLLVDDNEALEAIFSKCKLLIATHCEDEQTIIANSEKYREQYGEDVPMSAHPEIRSAEACYLSSSKAVALATKHGARLHVLHISTERELELFTNELPLANKKITAEACIHHLWFDDSDYETHGTRIKWNPAIKASSDKEAILRGLLDNHIDIIATDHAPHTLEEKNQSYFHAPSGGPLVQHALPALFEMYHNGAISIEDICRKTAHAPSECFQIDKRGFIREGYWADLVIIDPTTPWTVSKANSAYKCGWSTFEGQTFHSRITHTFVNGHLAYTNTKNNEEIGTFDESQMGQRLEFDRN